ncbi:MAG: sigma 54-interacting transcriptional regulator [Desulfobacterales bacterium]|nr:sigma 54-interacting transcriptional regulator [Desulfobacterales bacterium]
MPEKKDHFGLSFKTFARLVDNLHDEIIVYDKQYRIVYANRACERHYGYTQKEMIGRTLWDFTDEDDQCWNLSTLPYVFKLKAPLHQEQTTYIGAKIHTISLPLFDENGEIEYVAMSVRDKIKTEEIRRLVDVIELEDNPPERYRQGLIYRSEAMKAVVQLAHQMAEFDSPGLVLGESGSGKSLIAKYIHEQGDRADQPFVNVNCASIQASLFESELFGHRRGAFTGAETEKEGLIAKAEGGTLFLDEISELPLALQAKLLHVVQDREYRKVGSPNSRKADIRILAATNRNLREMVRNKAFREDLYYRLNVFEILIPPLRDRMEDIPPLVHHFLNQYGKRYALKKTVSADAMHLLKQYPWRGNIRELSHVMERLVVTTKDGVIDRKHLPKRIYQIDPITHAMGENWDSLDQALATVEKHIVTHGFSRHKSSRKLAKALGISQSRASRLIRKHLGKD